MYSVICGQPMHLALIPDLPEEIFSQCPLLGVSGNDFTGRIVPLPSWRPSQVLIRVLDSSRRSFHNISSLDMKFSLVPDKADKADKPEKADKSEAAPEAKAEKPAKADQAEKKAGKKKE